VIDLDRDLKIASLMAGDLKAYLLSDRIYWSLSETGPVSYPFPLGTLGGLFLRLRRLEFSEKRLSANQLRQLVAIRATVNEQLDTWAVQAESKAVHEIGARLQTWAAYLEDLADQLRRYAPEYPTQVEGRVILSLLFEFAGRAAGGQGFRARLEALDRQLRELASESTFVWDESLTAAFLHDPFWCLYLSPRH
jgi:hypothetical protein